MKQMIDDLFKTNGKWDITNPAFSAVPWIISIFTYLAMGCIHDYLHADTFLFQQFASGLALLFAGGGAGVWAHSHSQN